MLAWDEAQKALTTEPYEEVDSVYVPYERILQFDSVKKLETNRDEIRVSLKHCDEDNFLILEDGLQISNLYPMEPTDDENAIDIWN